MQNLISIIIATYNREHCVCNSINSAITAFKNCNTLSQIIVVDDCSTDQTEEAIKTTYSKEIIDNTIVYIKLENNKGVSGARNVGILQSRSQWIIFLDSDDTLIADSGNNISSELINNENAPVVFFRCIDQNGNKVGVFSKNNRESLSLEDFLISGSKGECLVAINRKTTTVLFEEDLRGYEGITIAKLIKYSKNNAILTNTIVRKYIQTGEDRLSSKSGFAKRIGLIGKGHWLMAKEFRTYMSLKTWFSYIIKSIAYQFLYYTYKILRII